MKADNARTGGASLLVPLVVAVLAAASLHAVTEQAVTDTAGVCATGAWKRWGITQPVSDSTAEPRFVVAWNQLYSDQYDSARQSYADLVRDYPNSAEAHLGLSMAWRYMFQRESAYIEVKKALVLDSTAAGVLCNYADLLQPGRGPYKSEPMSDSVRFATAVAAATRAAQSKYLCLLLAMPMGRGGPTTGVFAPIQHRYASEGHVSLWLDYMYVGRLADARREMKVLGEKSFFPPMLLDFARNLMTGLEPDAILFTNGDNDTEPLYCLQATEGFRPDVTIVNGTFLGIPKLMAAMRDSLKLPLTLTDKELAGKPKWSDVRDNIITNALKQNRPVYFAATFAPNNIGDWQKQTISEGVFRRVVEFKTESTDVAHTLANVNSWRLGTAGQKVEWPNQMSPMLRHITELNINYMVVLLDMADYYAEHRDTAQAEAMCKRAYGLVEHTGDSLRSAQVVAIWLKTNPGSAEAQELNRKLTELGRDVKSLMTKTVAQPSAADTAARAAATDSMLFRTSEPAPSGFETWTFFWVHPSVPEGAQVGYDVRSGAGEEYYRWGPKLMTPGDKSRSDFWSGQSEPSKLYGKEIVVRFWTTRGKLEFPADFAPSFEFYKKDWQPIKTIPGIRKD